MYNNSIVSSFQDAPLDAGGWGATLVELKNIKYYPLITQQDEK